MASGSSMESGGGLGPARIADRTVDHEVGDMDALRRQLARDALRQAAQGELAHRERRRELVALHAGRGAGEQDRALAAGQHAPGGLLRHEEAAERGDPQRIGHRRRIELDQRPARCARWRCRPRCPAARRAPSSIVSNSAATCSGSPASQATVAAPVAAAKPAQLVDVARRQADLDPLGREQARQRGAQPVARADDQGRPIVSMLLILTRLGRAFAARIHAAHSLPC